MKQTIVRLMTVSLLGLNFTLVHANIEARKLVEETTSLIMNQISNNREQINANPQRAAELVNNILLPHFDVTKMAKRTLGKYWKKADKNQQQRFTKEYEHLLIRTYSKVLANNVNSQINFLPSANGKKSGQTMVRTEVTQEAGFPVPINYKMRLTKGEWKVYDVIIDDISMATNYRSSFAKQIKREGIEKLITSLVEQNQLR